MERDATQRKHARPRVCAERLVRCGEPLSAASEAPPWRYSYTTSSLASASAASAA
jgi:hypothetical protein